MSDKASPAPSSPFSRRSFLRRGTAGLAAVGIGSLVLDACAAPTESSGTLGAYKDFLEKFDRPGDESAKPLLPPNVKGWAATEDNILGPYYRKGAPFRAKVTPPLAEGVVLLINGRVWGFDTKRPLAGAVLDIWQADHTGRYDNDDPNHPPDAHTFVNRARLICDETGYYEYETVHPGAYQTGPNEWRPSHVHYLIRHAGYKPLVTQLYFKGDPRNATDQFIKQSLIIEVAKRKVGLQEYEAGTFDIVLEPGNGDDKSGNG